MQSIMTTKKATQLALLTAVALALFVIELRIPALVPIPGVKVGLANIVTVFVVFFIGGKEAAAVLFCRIFLGAIFSGNFSTILYSGAGGLCAFAATIGIRRFLHRRQIWVAGVLGAVAHSIGQMGMAMLISGTKTLILYLPIMIFISVLTGIFTGMCAQILVLRGGKVWKISFR